LKTKFFVFSIPCIFQAIRICIPPQNLELYKSARLSANGSVLNIEVKLISTYIFHSRKNLKPGHQIVGIQPRRRLLLLPGQLMLLSGHVILVGDQLISVWVGRSGEGRGGSGQRS
jgi:hypothetical protein